MKILNNINVIISMKKYDTDTSLSFLPHTSLWYSKRRVLTWYKKLSETIASFSISWNVYASVNFGKAVWLS